MKRSKAERFLTISILILLAAACAKISSPSGGPRDRTPPVILETIPVYGAKNFSGDRIEITFDEYVSLNNINEKFMVSPPMKKKPMVFIRGRNVIIDLEEKLRDSTTYTFYFQDAIRDLNEGNTIDDYQFVLSTGPVVDSLSVTGNVYNAFDLEAPEKTMVLLYRELADSFVVKHLPDYISRVDPKGYFRINNVKEGTYRIYALKDADNSKNYNLPDEEFAFMNSPVTITPENNYIPPEKDTLPAKPVVKELPKTRDGRTMEENTVQDTIVRIGEYPLMLFSAPKTNHYLTSSGRPLNYQFIYTLSLPPDTMDFLFRLPESPGKGYFIEKSLQKDTIRVWLTDSTLYSQSQLNTIVDYPFTDTLGITSYREDTILMRFLAPRSSRVSRIKKAAFTYETNLRSNTLKPGQKIYFRAGTPLAEPDTSRILFYQADSVKKRVPYRLTRDSTTTTRYYLDADLEEGSKYFFIADSASFGNIYGECADSAGYNFSVKKADSYSKITVSVINCTTDCIIQLLNNQEKVVNQRTISTDGKIVFPLLDAGTYRLKVIYDLNGDGKWTTGDFSKEIQPEPVSYYPLEIDLKSGWVLDIDQDWDISKHNFKAQKLRQKKSTRK